MAKVEGHEDDPMQPALRDDGSFIWPGDEGAKKKAVAGVFVIDKYLTPTTIGDPISTECPTESPVDGKKGGKKSLNLRISMRLQNKMK